MSVIDSCDDYVALMEELFDFGQIKALLARNDFKMCFDGMHGVAGPYAMRIFGDILCVPKCELMRCNILEDFGGAHPDPNLTYAPELVKKMGIFVPNEDAPDFAAACDGDADRNMILGKRFFVSPSDSLAMIVSNYKLIPNLNRGRPLAGVARSMPTSGALDRVAKAMGIKVIYF